jgi:hypothetical protein
VTRHFSSDDEEKAEREKEQWRRICILSKENYNIAAKCAEFFSFLARTPRAPFIYNSFEYTSETFHANSSIKINHFRLHIIVPFGAHCHIFKLLPRIRREKKSRVSLAHPPIFHTIKFGGTTRAERSRNEQITINLGSYNLARLKEVAESHKSGCAIWLIIGGADH